MRKIFAVVAILIAVALVNGVIGQRDRYAGPQSIVRAGADTFFATKTVILTIDAVPAGTTDDFAFVANANETAQSIAVFTLPANGEIVSAQIRCIESTSAGTFDVSLGSAAAAFEDMLTTTTVDAAGEINPNVAAASPLKTASGSAVTVRMKGDPTSVNWDALTAGRWAIMITYIDYGAVYSAN